MRRPSEPAFPRSGRPRLALQTPVPLLPSRNVSCSRHGRSGYAPRPGSPGTKSTPATSQGRKPHSPAGEKRGEAAFSGTIHYPQYPQYPQKGFFPGILGIVGILRIYFPLRYHPRTSPTIPCLHPLNVAGLTRNTGLGVLPGPLDSCGSARMKQRSSSS